MAQAQQAAAAQQQQVAKGGAAVKEEEAQQPGGRQPTERSVAQAEAGGEMSDLPPQVLAEVQRLAQMQGQSPPQ